MTDQVAIREVGMRDGLQIVRSRMTTEQKKQWIKAAVEAGFQEMEITSFVPAKYLPQFMDAAEITEYANTFRGFNSCILAPNLKGAEAAIRAGARTITFIVTASESFSQANLRRPVATSVAEFKALVDLCAALPEGNRPLVAAGISSAFGCSLEGRIPESHVAQLVETLIETGAEEVLIADTVGYADPQLVRNITKLVLPLCRSANIRLGYHFHDTRGLGLANVLAALEGGIRQFDASLGGIGGCPNSPRATGNISTEDLALMLDAMGLRTGLDLTRLAALRQWVEQQMPNERFYGHLLQAGLPTGYRPTAALN